MPPDVVQKSKIKRKEKGENLKTKTLGIELSKHKSCVVLIGASIKLEGSRKGIRKWEARASLKKIISSDLKNLFLFLHPRRKGTLKQNFQIISNPGRG